MKLPLLYYGHPILRMKCEPVKEITDDIRQLVKDMIDTMVANDGAGLAAPQVGRPIRLFILCTYMEASDGSVTMTEPKVYINPKLSSPSDDVIEDVEGCLSVPGLRMNVVRPAKISLEATDLDGSVFFEEFEGYNARCRMHENDHLNGVLCVDRTDGRTKKKLEPLLKAMKKKYNP